MSVPLDTYMRRYPDATQWTVSRCRYDRRRVIVRPDGSTSLPRWVTDLRRLLPLLQTRKPAELLELVRHSGAIDLGVLDGRDAQRISEILGQSASIIDVSDASSVSYSPRVDGGGLIIEDDAENKAFCLRLIELGARVEEVER